MLSFFEVPEENAYARHCSECLARSVSENSGFSGGDGATPVAAGNKRIRAGPKLDECMSVKSTEEGMLSVYQAATAFQRIQPCRGGQPIDPTQIKLFKPRHIQNRIRKFFDWVSTQIDLTQFRHLPDA